LAWLAWLAWLGWLGLASLGLACLGLARVVPALAKKGQKPENQQTTKNVRFLIEKLHFRSFSRKVYKM
jgi:Trk-type K+ transport system membrane component